MPDRERREEHRDESQAEARGASESEGVHRVPSGSSPCTSVSDSSCRGRPPPAPLASDEGPDRVEARPEGLDDPVAREQRRHPLDDRAPLGGRHAAAPRDVGDHHHAPLEAAHQHEDRVAAGCREQLARQEHDLGPLAHFLVHAAVADEQRARIPAPACSRARPARRRRGSWPPARAAHRASSNPAEQRAGQRAQRRQRCPERERPPRHFGIEVGAPLDRGDDLDAGACLERRDAALDRRGFVAVTTVRAPSMHASTSSRLPDARHACRP